MSDAPERIWAWNFTASKQDEVVKGGWDDKQDRGLQEYIRADKVQALVDRADLSDALVRAALERAAIASDEVAAAYNVMKKDGKTYEPMRVQSAAKSMVRLASEDIRALSADPEAVAAIVAQVMEVK